MAVTYKLGKVNICENQTLGGLIISHALYDSHDASGPTSFCIARDPTNSDILLPLCKKYGISVGIDVNDKRIKTDKSSPLELAINQTDFSDESFGFQIDKLEKRTLRTLAPEYMTLIERVHARYGNEAASIVLAFSGAMSIFGGIIGVVFSVTHDTSPLFPLASGLAGVLGGYLITNELSDKFSAPSLRKAIQDDARRAKYVRALAHHIAKKEYALAQLNEQLIEQKIKLDVAASMPLQGHSSSLDALLTKRDGALVAKMKGNDEKRITLTHSLSAIYDAFAMLTVGEEFWKHGAALSYTSKNPDDVRAFIREVEAMVQLNVPIAHTPMQLERVDNSMPPQMDEGSSQVTT